MAKTLLSISCWLVVAAVVLATIVAYNNPKYYAWAGGGIPCGLFLTFDKFVFSTEATIPIKVDDTCGYHQGKTMTVIVSNPDEGIDNSTGMAIITEDATYLNKQATVSDKNTVVFEIPKGTNDYRFLVTLMDDMNQITDQKLIFTKEQADIVRVSDITIPGNVSAGSMFKVQATITDGLDNPVAKIVRVRVALQRPECTPNSYPQSILEFDLRRDSTDPAKYIAQVALPSDFASGLYKSSLSIFSNPSEGYRLPEPVQSQIRVGNGSIPVTTLFYNVEKLNGTIFSRAGGGVRYALGDDVVVKGQVLTDDCQPLQGVKITGDLFGYPTPLIRYNTTSDAAGNFTVHFQTYPHLKIGEQYFITLKGEYSNRTLTWNDDHVFFDDVQRFPFTIEGKRSVAEVSANQEGKVVSLTLDKDLKKITAIVESQRNEQAQYNIAIPSELLSGDVIILKDGGDPITLIGKQYFADGYGPEMDAANNDYRHSYSLTAYKGNGLMTVGYVNLAGGRTTIEITGTSTIPEFGALSIVVISIAVMAVVVAITAVKRNLRYDL